MTYHFKFSEVSILVDNNIAVLLTGEKGSGKTTLAMQIAKHLNLPFYSVGMTRQTTLSYLLGFINVNGEYTPSLLRKAVEHGGLFLLDEIDAGDANVLLALNTLENGYLAFPDKIIDCHSDFRLIASSNPQDQHSHYTGRSKLDGATLDRFDIIEVPRDGELEKTLVDDDVSLRMDILRKSIIDNNSSVIVTMRDAIRYQKRKKLNLLDGFVEKLVNSDLVINKYYDELNKLPQHDNQSECLNVDELFNLLNARSNQ